MQKNNEICIVGKQQYMLITQTVALSKNPGNSGAKRVMLTPMLFSLQLYYAVTVLAFGKPFSNTGQQVQYRRCQEILSLIHI
ncbi:hypothetical protein T4B_13499 [Trichinella pseudospiralis]|uniref:Uncharacterized protein n=1 Tax=Trichinella pseudospiralis TaxID=6337 RepID=A0A0V1IC38_TRIPS|nr:hypothetical protein T4B_13499 [Trichinella pseudospiralis]